jgi:hypothetical protein
MMCLARHDANTGAMDETDACPASGSTPAYRFSFMGSFGLAAEPSPKKPPPSRREETRLEVGINLTRRAHPPDMRTSTMKQTGASTEQPQE